MKLFTRYNRINLTVMVILFLISGISYYFLINYVLIHELDEALEDYREKIENYIDENDRIPTIGLMDETRVSYVPYSGQEHHSELLTRKFKDDNHKYRELTFYKKAEKIYYRISLAKPIEGVKMLTRTVVMITITMLLIVITTTVILNLVILRRLWQPFYGSLSAMKNFKLGRKQIPVFPSTGIEEFAYMNKLLKDTISSAETEYQVLKEFTENASHEMQTPLAIIRSKLDLVIQEEGLSIKQTQALSSIYSGIKRLTKLNQSLLLLAKIENNQFAEIISINLEDKINEKLDQFNEFWQNNRITCTTDLHPSTIQSNPELIDILLSNLISNAGRHNREGGTIFIQLLSNKLIIENTGQNNSLDHKRLFVRFYKEAQHSRHNGLGLSIVKQICEQLSIGIHYDFAHGLHRFTLSWN